MFSSPRLLIAALGLSSFVTASLQSRAFDETEYAHLPACATTCIDQLESVFNCTIQSTCFCFNGNVTAAYAACLGSHCTVAQDLLTGEKFQAQTCNVTVRSKVALTRGIAWGMFSLVTIFVSLRLLSRAKYFRGTGFGWDDYVVMFCYALVVPLDVSLDMEAQNGLGQDMYMLNVDQVTEILRWFYAGELLYNTIIMSTKIAILLLYLRIWTADSITPAFRKACWCIIGVLVLTCIAFNFGIAFQCSPVSFAWTKLLGTTGNCFQIEPMIYTFGALNISYDVVVYFLPIHTLLNLRIPWQKKVGVCVIFLIGFVVTICSIVRLQYLVRIDLSKNITWDFQYIGMWSIVEASLATVVICVPATAGLGRRIMKGGFRHPTTSTLNGSTSTQKPVSGVFNDSSDDSSTFRTVTNHLGDPEKALLRGREAALENAELRPDKVGEIIEDPEHNLSSSASEVLERTRPSRPGLNASAILHRSNPRDGRPKVEICHDPPSEPTEARLTYRDDNDVLHTVILQDIPEGRIPGPRGAKSSKTVHALGGGSSAETAAHASSSKVSDAVVLPATPPEPRNPT